MSFNFSYFFYEQFLSEVILELRVEMDAKFTFPGLIF